VSCLIGLQRIQALQEWFDLAYLIKQEEYIQTSSVISFKLHMQPVHIAYVIAVATYKAFRAVKSGQLIKNTI